MQQRKLGQQGLEVAAIGLGTMGMTMAYGPNEDDERSIRTLHRAHDCLLYTSPRPRDGLLSRMPSSA